MSKVIYRDINKKDYEDIKNLICEAFGFDKFIKNEKLLDITTALYLQECIEDSSFSKIAGKENSFEGCIQLFIVSKESRGLGIGKKLLSYLFEYMKSREVNSMYLYTDTRCNYKFYDSQNFKFLSEKELIFDSINKKLDVFLYGYKFN